MSSVRESVAVGEMTAKRQLVDELHMTTSVFIHFLASVVVYKHMGGLARVQTGVPPRKYLPNLPKFMRMLEIKMYYSM